MENKRCHQEQKGGAKKSPRKKTATTKNKNYNNKLQETVAQNTHVVAQQSESTAKPLQHSYVCAYVAECNKEAWLPLYSEMTHQQTWVNIKFARRKKKEMRAALRCSQDSQSRKMCHQWLWVVLLIMMKDWHKWVWCCATVEGKPSVLPLLSGQKTYRQEVNVIFFLSFLIAQVWRHAKIYPADRHSIRTC